MDEALQSTSIDDGEEFVLPTNIEGSETLQRDLRRINKFKKCFRKNVAKTPPMKLKVDVDKWMNCTQSKGRYRPHSDAKYAEIERQVKLLLDLKVIQLSKSANDVRLPRTSSAQTRRQMAILLGF